jgi:MoxR-like ATPase
MAGKRGPAPARLVTIHKHPRSGRNMAVTSTGRAIHIRDLTRVELVKTCARSGLSIPPGRTKWLECTNEVMITMLERMDAPVWTAPETEPDPAPTPEPEISQETEPTPKENDVATPTDMDQALRVLKELLGGGGIDPAQLESMVEQAVNKVVARPVVVKLADLPDVSFDGELVHECFEALVRKVRAGVHVFLTGGPGVGKTTVTEQVARALGMDHVVATMKPLPQDHEFIGFVSPVTGKVVTGNVRNLYENGGILVLDEFDTAHPSTPPTLNMLLAQDYFDFPGNDGKVERVTKHKDFRVIATGNTYGGGGSLEFAGTTRMNTATMDRFTFFHVGVDKKLEDAICRSIHPVHGPAVVSVVRQVRKNIDKYALKVFVTPRASIDATKLMVAGDSMAQAFDGRLVGRGLPKDQESKLLEGVTFG